MFLLLCGKLWKPRDFFAITLEENGGCNSLQWLGTWKFEGLGFESRLEEGLVMLSLCTCIFSIKLVFVVFFVHYALLLACFICTLQSHCICELLTLLICIVVKNLGFQNHEV